MDMELEPEEPVHLRYKGEEIGRIEVTDDGVCIVFCASIHNTSFNIDMSPRD